VLVGQLPIPILQQHSKKKWHVSEVINFVPFLNYLKIKQS